MFLDQLNNLIRLVQVYTTCVILIKRISFTLIAKKKSAVRQDPHLYRISMSLYALQQLFIDCCDMQLNQRSLSLKAFFVSVNSLLSHHFNQLNLTENRCEQLIFQCQNHTLPLYCRTHASAFTLHYEHLLYNIKLKSIVQLKQNVQYNISTILMKA